jgi:hypothetical protein
MVSSDLLSDGGVMENLVTERQRPYLAYLLRLWQVQDKGKIGWRASLENAHTGEKLAFAHLDQLVAFLRERVGQAPLVNSLAKHDCTSEIDSASEQGGS